MSNVVIIGGGAAGMMSAIIAARGGHKVTIIEQQAKLGRKILSTGNGRCNFTNEEQNPSCYHSANPDFPFAVYEQFPYDKTIEFFCKLGIYPKSRNGYIYPNSDQAVAVVSTMVMELERLKVIILLNARCERILPSKDSSFSIFVEKNAEKAPESTNAKFALNSVMRESSSTDANYIVSWKEEENSSTVNNLDANSERRDSKETGENINADKVILTTGGRAAPILGSDGSGYKLAEWLAHNIIPVYPSLVQLKCEESYYKQLAGLRMDGSISIYLNGREVAKDKGEIQLTNYGISGIPVFQVSGTVAKELAKGHEVIGVLNFMPHMSLRELEAHLTQRIDNNPDKLMGEFLIGLLPKKFADLIIKLCRFNPGDKVANIKAKDETMLTKLALHIVQFETKIIGTNSFDQAQVCSGGVDTKEIDSKTMESLLIRNLYFAGEVVDVDGKCGGYNLQWAWSSGYVAGLLS